MLRTFIIILFMYSILITTATAGMNEFESCRCENRLATKGDTKQEVQEVCGKPVHVYYNLRRDCREMWLYNFGPNAFMQGICFENDRVKKVLSLTRGY
jgi:hypothetical protein